MDIGGHLQESEWSTHGGAHQANGSSIWSVGPTCPSNVAKDWMVTVCLSMVGNPLIYSGWISNVCSPPGQMFHLQTAWCFNPACPALETDDGHNHVIDTIDIHGWSSSYIYMAPFYKLKRILKGPTIWTTELSVHFIVLSFHFIVTSFKRKKKKVG